MNRGPAIYRRHGGANGDGVGGGDVVGGRLIFHLHTAASGLVNDDRRQHMEGDGFTNVFCNT